MSISSTMEQWFFRRIKPQAGEIALEQRTIYVLPTRYGLFFGVVLIIMLLGSVNYSNSMGFLLTFLLSGLVLVSMLHTYRNLSHLKISVGKTQPVFNGDTATFQLILSTRDNSPAYSISVAAQKNAAHFETKDISSSAKPLSSVPFSLRKKTAQRGVLALGKVRLWTEYPLGLFHVWSWIEPQTSILVYPKPSGIRSEPPVANLNAGSNKPRGFGNDDYVGMRNYHAGDSLSHIAWKVLARNDTTMTKQFSDLADEEVWLDWFALEKMDAEKKLSQLCQWVIDMHQAGRHYGLRLPNKTIQPANSVVHKAQCLEALALYKV